MHEKEAALETNTKSPGISRRGVLQGLSLTALTLSTGALDQAFARDASARGSFNPRRWWEHDYRIVQTNLREIDILEDPREIARAVKEFGGNTIVSNIGGIVAFYPTELEYHYKNPYMKSDFVAEMIEAARSEGLAYLARFDTSKGMGAAYRAHPEWFVVNRDGSPREYAGTYQACPAGGWLQDYAQRILREALTRYKPDGVFFNGVGYIQNDYAGIDRGICVCENCRREFRAMYGLELPAQNGFGDPNWRTYMDFTERVTAGIHVKLRALADELIPGVPITRYDEYQYVGRGETQRRVRRAAPEWQYQSGEQVLRAKGRNPGKPWSSTSAAHIDYPWRQVTETPAYHISRLAQLLGHGGKLDLYLMGSIKDQDDQTFLPPVSALFKWEATHTRHYDGLRPIARVALYDSEATEKFGAQTPYAQYRANSFRGAYSALVDSRIPFQCLNSAHATDGTIKLKETFDVIVAPNVMLMGAEEAAALDRFVEQGGLLIASGMAAAFNERGDPLTEVALKSLPTTRYAKPENAEGWTLDPHKGEFKFTTNRVPLDALYFGGELRRGVKNLVPFAPDQRYGPPEFSYAIPDDKPRTVPGVAVLSHGRGNTVHIPWLYEWHYYRDNLPMHQELMASLIQRYAPAQTWTLTGDGPVELTTQRTADGGTLLHVINYAGQRNGRYNEPPKLHGLTLQVAGRIRGDVRALVAGQTLSTTAANGGQTSIALPPVGAFEAILIPA